MKKTLGFALSMALVSSAAPAQHATNWRGPNSTGVYPDTGLLKQWPEGGPPLLWSTEGIGTGYSSASIGNDAIYVTGRDGDLDNLSALTLQGELKWTIPFGKAWDHSFPESRTTPTLEDGRAYAISGHGDVVAVDTRTGEIVWSVQAFEKFKGKYGDWGVCESPLIVDNKLIYTVGGDLTTVVALDKRTGDTVWQSSSLHDWTGYVTSVLINHGGRRIIVSLTANYLIGLEPKDGTILWNFKYTDINPDDSGSGRGINTNTPLYIDGRLFVTSGYNHVGAMFELSDDGTAIKHRWTSRDLDTHMGGVVHVDGYIYGSNWINNREGNWVALDVQTGKKMYETKWHNKGVVISADGMLYCYDDRQGNFGLAKATPTGFNIVSSFRVTLGDGPHWAHPVIADGVLYIRRGDVLMAYDIKAG